LKVERVRGICNSLRHPEYQLPPEKIKIEMAVHSDILPQNLIAGIKIYSRDSPIGKVILLLPSLLSIGLIIESGYKPLRMINDKV
jgi:hypothetical protein